MKTPARRLLVTLASLTSIAAGTGGLASSAQADPVTATLCNDAALSQPFTAWNDNAHYELAPGGDFESSGWTLSNGAQVVSGSEPFAATGTLGSASLSLPAGASAESPQTCINAAYPTMRMFVGGTGLALVQVVYNGVAIPSGFVHAGGSWQPSPILRTNGAIFGLLSGGTANVTLRITALTGKPSIDDVFIDPWNRT
jgi:hypothetical protein